MREINSADTIETPWSASDEEALAHESQRTPALFRKLYLQWVNSIYKYFLHKVGDQHVAEDLTSLVFLKAFEQLPRYKHRGHFAAWLFAIARNTARDHFRKSTREVAMELAKEPAIPSDPLDEIILTHEIKRLHNLIGVLPEGELELIRLRYVAGLSYAEIGVIVRRSEEAVRKAIIRLLARLRGRLEDNHG
jgi:RNA polymerase sigma factor (sigma-70 family)